MLCCTALCITDTLVKSPVVDFFVWILSQFLLDIFIRIMGLPTGGRFVLSAWNEANKVKHRG